MLRVDPQFHTLKKIVLQHRTAFIQTMALIAISSGLVLLVPVWVKELVTGIIPTKDLWQLQKHIGMGLVMLLVIEAFCYGRDFYRMRLSLLICAGLRRQVFTTIVNASLQALGEHKRGELISRLTNDINALQEALRFGVFSLLPNLAIVVGLLAMMVYYSPLLSLIALALVGPITGSVRFFGRMMRARTTTVQRHLGELNTIVDETVTGILDIKSFVQEERRLARFDQANDDALACQVELDRVRALNPAVVSFVAFATIGVLILVSCWMVFRNVIPIDRLTPFLTCLLLVFYPLEDVSRAFGAIGKIYALLERFETLFQTQAEYPVDTRQATLPRVSGRIRFEHVGFSYDGNFRMSDIDLTIEAGETVAFVGPSGGGKTTLMMLVSRLIEPTAGAITIDQLPISAYRIDSLRRQIGWVPQEPVLIGGSLLENITFAAPEADLEQVMAAAKAAHIDEFAAQLPQGYHTPIGQFGGRLSVGQRQRIAIARALLIDPPILIMDEPTSALDAESERLLQDSFRRLRRGRTTLIIAHRLSTIWEAGRIIVLADGKIVESGRHDTLMKQAGLYNKLFSNQMVIHSRSD